MRRNLIYILILVIGITILFGPGLFTYFVQDDFFYFKLISGITPLNILEIFLPVAGAVWYRPLSAQYFFYFSKLLFGLNPIPYHIVVYLTHIGTSLVIYKILRNQGQTQMTASFGALIYGFHQIHTISLAWLATYSFILAPFLITCASFFYLKRNVTMSFLFFIMATLASEVSILFPICIFIYEYWIRQRWLQLLPYFTVVLAVVFFRYFIFPTQVDTQLYSMSLGIFNISLVKFYVLRLFGLPLMVDALDPVLKFSVIALSLSTLIILCLGLFEWVKDEQDIGSRSRMKFYFILGTGFLGPFLLLPNHLAPYYLSFSLVGFAPITAILITIAIQSVKIYKQFFIVCFILIFLTLQFIGSRWTYQTHWIFKRAKLAEKLIQKNELSQPVGSEGYFALGADAIYYFK